MEEIEKYIGPRSYNIEENLDIYQWYRTHRNNRQAKKELYELFLNDKLVFVDDIHIIENENKKLKSKILLLENELKKLSLVRST